MTKNSTAVDPDTPMMQQYQSIKRSYPGAILFYRMGDFYEMFNEDAQTASRILQIALTARNKNRPNPTPMCGIPYHSANGYISKLIQAGKNVAICEQVEDAKLAKGLVKRDVVRIVTPGTFLDDSHMDPKCPHNLVAVFADQNGYGLATLDISTGHFKTAELTGPSAEDLLIDELEKLSPREVLIPKTSAERNHSAWMKMHADRLQTEEDWAFSFSDAHQRLTEHFGSHSLEGFGCETLRLAVSSAGGLLRYLQETQKNALPHIRSLSTYNLNADMLLDQSAIRSLELVQSSDGNRKGSLLDALDQSQTPMGARRIREWILKPLLDKNVICNRLDRVESLLKHPLHRDEIRQSLKNMYDLERLLGRLTLAVAGSPRDLIALKSSLAVLPSIHNQLQSIGSDFFSQWLQEWDSMEDLFDLIEQWIEDDPPQSIKDGHVIKAGCSEELDRLKKIKQTTRQWIVELETRERKRTGIPILKVGYNKIYGYFIEVTKKNVDRVPVEYIRKQSLVNAERYISPELKDFETEISGAEEKIAELENELFEKVKKDVLSHGQRIQKMASLIADVDGMCGFAQTASQNNYCRPVLRDDSILKITNGRHPLIERIDTSHLFVSNDIDLDGADNQIMIITGPNMAGKSTYLRQVALIVLMAQIGSFVPADEVEMGIVDRIFSRVGAQDHLQKGQSTFMVEMNETANILNHATEKSLIILDEIGRGTSTYDGISIAWSIVEYLHKGKNSFGPKTLFATHYHELTQLSAELPGVRNFNVQVKEWNDEIIFLRKIAPGGADKSYGIQVARLAGLPKQVLERAREVLNNLESAEFQEPDASRIGHMEKSVPDETPKQMGLFAPSLHPVVEQLNQLKPDEFSPRQALDILYQLVEQAREHNQ
ncbi:MAG: DNA mismatch repair protein MutS [Nitrospinae bacterium CG11_big_fil_rev_8_21_14_0_20_45_15]|nr:MAG: DNA mismatch repair protein MutS [Nitrospinae bacterium CG11_big_fil_rev_8_21_14_0_20_45_15]